MKKCWNLSLGIIVIACSVACDHDENPSEIENPVGSNVVVSLGEDKICSEDDDVLEVIIPFNHPATINGIISLEVDSEFTSDFTCIPELNDDLLMIEVKAGDEFAKFEIYPDNNLVNDGDKNITIHLLNVSDGFIIGNNKTLSVTIVDDERSTNGKVFANFIVSSESIAENLEEGIEIAIMLSEPAPKQEELVIYQSGSVPDLYFNTVPELNENGTLTLLVTPGTTELSFKVIPIHDELLKGHQEVIFEIGNDASSIIKGNQPLFTLNIMDKELLGKPKSYDSYGGGWRVKYTYHYNSLGKVSQVDWENYTPALRAGQYQYYYAVNGLIERINFTSSRDEYFFQENGRIVKSEIVAHGDVVSYSFYDYDTEGNIGAKLEYVKNPQGEYEKSLLYIYLYFNNGNIYKQLTYIPGEQEGNEELISTRTFDAYFADKSNYFPMFEVIHGINSQPNLPSYHRVQENGKDLQYQLSYEFDEKGNTTTRTVTGPGTNEITYYEYY